MKKVLLLALFAAFLSPKSFSQLCGINMDIYGNFEAVIAVGDGTVTISQTGEVLDYDLNGRVEYIFSGYDNGGKIKSIGDVDFDYIFTGYDNGGKVEEIGGIDIDYIFTDYDNGGKIKSIGNVDFDYIFTGYDNGGKIEEIGNIDLDYIFTGYDNGGKLKSIENEKFEYIFEGYNNGGKMKSGRRNFVVNGIRFKISERRLNC